MEERLKELYRSVILEQNNNPHNYKKLVNFTHKIEAYNPLCGDKFQIFLNVEKGKIEDIGFQGYGCAVSKASTSVLTKNLMGKKLEELLPIFQEFDQIVRKDNTEQVENEEFKAFEAAKSFSGRLKCATLSWDEVEKVLLKN